jgi:hypothetical protein
MRITHSCRQANHRIERRTGMQKRNDDELTKQRLDLALDKELEDTFPASDAPKITRSRSDKPAPVRPAARIED